jgi:hypothetical protein
MNPAVGSTLWQLLHAYALAYPETADEQTKGGAALWLADWDKLVEQNSTGCKSCHKKWCLLVSRHPPNLSGSAAFSRWTVAAHDWINRELGKPIHANAISLQHAIFGVKVPNG